MQHNEITAIINDTKHVNALVNALMSHDYQAAQNPQTMEQDYESFMAGYKAISIADLKGRSKICYNAGQQLRTSELQVYAEQAAQRRKEKQKRNAANRLARAEENRAANLKKSKGGK